MAQVQPSSIFTGEAAPLNPMHSVHRERLRLGMRASTREGMLAALLVTMSLPANIFITALVTKGFVLSRSTIGSLTSVPFACNFLQTKDVLDS